MDAERMDQPTLMTWGYSSSTRCDTSRCFSTCTHHTQSLLLPRGLHAHTLTSKKAWPPLTPKLARAPAQMYANPSSHIGSALRKSALSTLRLRSESSADTNSQSGAPPSDNKTTYTNSTARHSHRKLVHPPPKPFWMRS